MDGEPARDGRARADQVTDAASEDAAEIRRGVTRLARRLRAERSADALSANKIGVLAHLRQHGPTTPGDLAARDHQQPQSLTRVFAELEEAGLISRSRSTVDRRQSVLSITHQGVEVLARDMAERDAWLVSVLGRLSDTERQVLRIAGTLMNEIAGT